VFLLIRWPGKTEEKKIRGEKKKKKNGRLPVASAGKRWKREKWQNASKPEAD
jgi:hypothetical protein